MSRYHSYLNSAAAILRPYKGEEPFAAYLKKFFAANKKYGSKDRKQIADLCYSYWRLGGTLKELSVEERILAAVFICHSDRQEIIEHLKPEWSTATTLPLREKFNLLGAGFKPGEIFPWLNDVSAEIDKENFAASFLVQPDLFLRVRPGKENTVREKLSTAGIQFTALSPTCLALPNTSQVDSVIELNKEAVVQDYSSQRIAEFLVTLNALPDLRVWDCCAASGGKSILAADILGKIKLTVSDIRSSILVNLEKRLAAAGINHYESFVADLSRELPGDTTGLYDLVIADVPCSGSGTWSRTPEQLSFYKTATTDDYAALQKKICTTVMARLKRGGYFLYITCSVFTKENEEAIEFLQKKFHLRLLKMELLKGYELKADSMFAVLLQLPL